MLVVAVVVALVVGLGLGALGGVLLSGGDDDSSASDRGRDDNEGDDEPSEDAGDDPGEAESDVPEPPAPTEAESAEVPSGGEGEEGETIDGLTPPTLDGWDITSVRVSRDYVDDFEVGFEATNAGDVPQSVFWSVTLLASGEEVGSLSCTEGEVAPGDTIEVTCFTGDDFRDDVDEVLVEAEL